MREFGRLPELQSVFNVYSAPLGLVKDSQILGLYPNLFCIID